MVLLAKCPPHQHLDCNISHDRYLPDALRSTKQLRPSILPKDTDTLALAGLELTVWWSWVLHCSTRQHVLSAHGTLLQIHKRTLDTVIWFNYFPFNHGIMETILSLAFHTHTHTPTHPPYPHTSTHTTTPTPTHTPPPITHPHTPTHPSNW